MPLEGAFGAAAALAVAAALVAVAGTLRGPVFGQHVFRRPDTEAAAGLLLVLGVVCYGMSGAALRDHDLGQRLGAPDRLLTDAATMAAMAAVVGLLLLSAHSWADSRSRVLHRLTSLTACVTGMALCAASGPGSLEKLIYFTLYVAFLGAALTEIVALSWQRSRLVRRRPLHQACYLLVHSGALAGIAGLAGQTVWAVATAPHMLPPALPTARSCAGLAAPPQCVFTVTLPSASVLLAVAGVALPTVGGGIAAACRFWHHVWMLRTLGPLWERMRHTFPQVSLPEHGNRGRLDPAFRMYRRVIEIGDALMLLRPYMRPGAQAAAAATAAQFGLRGEELRATVEAAEIVAALRAHRTADCYDPPPPDHADADAPNLIVEAAWLVKVARAYATSPIVYQLMMNRR